jgi:hypothetical protein
MLSIYSHLCIHRDRLKERERITQEKLENITED